MPFRTTDGQKQRINHQIFYDSLQIPRLQSPPNDKTKSRLRRRVSSSISLKASMTVETALVLPVFLFALSFILYFAEISRIQLKVGNELYQAGKELAMYAYACEHTEASTGIPSAIAGSGYVKACLLRLDSQYIKEAGVEGGTGGISLACSDYDKDNMIDIVAAYKINIPCNFFGLGKVPVLQRCRIRKWTGYKADKETGGQEQETVVYITKNGSVYHISIECTHLNLSVRPVKAGEVDALRSQDGSRYYACELCTDDEKMLWVFITDTGNRYHNDRGCSGLKRDIISIPLSQAGTRKSCSRCGG